MLSASTVPGLTSVIVVTANSGPISLRCVNNVLGSKAPLELTVVDNASSDGQLAEIERLHGTDSRLHIQRNVENVGFGPAANQAASASEGEWLLVLNPDCLVDSDTIENLCSIARSQARAGIIGAHIVDKHGHRANANRRRDPTLLRVLMSLSGLARLERRWPSLAGIDMPDLPQAPETEHVDAVSGACLFMRRDVFAAIGGFDEGYFLHCEDLDLCRRVRDAGFEVCYADSIVVVHEQGSSSHRRALFVARHKHLGMWRYFRKFDPAAQNPVLRGLVWCGIWTHFWLLAPLKAWQQRRQQSI
ncbi:MAG: glycosyltransferase family 2 protein [Xanthomonadales bacterium]|nr:glycosyltransferase family 2 protein [Xanthomonadales bacterium]